MTSLSTTPDLATLEIPMDAWTEPFWNAAADGQLLVPRCSACHRFRWPPGPFCPHCRSQRIEWTQPGAGLIYSYTLIPEQRGEAGDPQRYRAPALIEFPEVDGIRMLAAIVDSPLTDIRIGAEVEAGWSDAMNARVPVFRTLR